MVRTAFAALLIAIGLIGAPAIAVASDLLPVGGEPTTTIGSGPPVVGPVSTPPIFGGGNTGTVPIGGAATTPTDGSQNQGGGSAPPVALSGPASCDAGTTADTPAVAQCIAQQNSPQPLSGTYFRNLIQRYASASCVNGVGLPNGAPTPPQGIDGVLNNLSNPLTMSGQPGVSPYPLSSYGYKIGSAIAFALMGFSMLLWFKNTHREGATDVFRAIFATEAKFFGLGIVMLGMQFAAGEGMFAGNQAPAVVKLGEVASAIGAGAAQYIGVRGAGNQSFRIDTPGQAFQVSYCLALKVDAIPSLAALAKAEQVSVGRQPWDIFGKASDAVAGAAGSIEVAIFSLVNFLLMLIIGLILAVQLMLVKWGAIVIGGLGVLFLGFEMLERTRPLAEGYWKFVQGNVVGVLTISIVTTFIAALVDNVIQGIVNDLATPLNVPLSAALPGGTYALASVGSASMGALGKIFFVCMFALVLTIAIPRLTSSFLSGGAALIGGDLIAGVAGAGAIAGGAAAGVMGAMRGLTKGLEKLRSTMAEASNGQSTNAIGSGQGSKDANQVGKAPEIADDAADAQAAPRRDDVEAPTRPGSSRSLSAAAHAVAAPAHGGARSAALGADAAVAGVESAGAMDPNAALMQAAEEDEEASRAFEESVEVHALTPDAVADAAPTASSSAANHMPSSGAAASSTPTPLIDIADAAAAGTVAADALQTGSPAKKGRRRKRSAANGAAAGQQQVVPSADGAAPADSTRVDSPQAGVSSPGAAASTQAASPSAESGAQAIAGTLRSSVGAVNEAGSQTASAAQSGDVAALPAPLAAVAQANAQLADTIQTVSALSADLGTAMTDLSKRQAVERAAMRDGLRSLGRAASAVGPIAQLAQSNPALAPQAAAAAGAVASASSALATGGVTPAAASQMGAATNSVASLAVAAQQAGAPAAVVRSLANAATDLGVQYQVAEGVASTVTAPPAPATGAVQHSGAAPAAPAPSAPPAPAPGSVAGGGMDMSPAQMTAFEALMDRSFGAVARSTDALAETMASHAQTLEDHGRRLAAPDKAQRRGNFYQNLLGVAPQIKRTAASLLTDHNHSAPGVTPHKH